MNDVVVGSEALRLGTLSRCQLRAGFRAIFPDVYLANCAAPTLRTRSEAAWLWSGRRGVLAGLAAAALHGSDWISDDEPVELIWRNPHAPAGVITRNHRVEGDEVTRVAGLPVTTPARTAFDLARQLPTGEAVARLDALMRATPFSSEDVLLLAKRDPGARGVRRLRAVLPLVDSGAASPKETWLRLLLIDAGLPAPQTQIPVIAQGRRIRRRPTPQQPTPIRAGCAPTQGAGGLRLGRRAGNRRGSARGRGALGPRGTRPPWIPRHFSHVHEPPQSVTMV